MGNDYIKEINFVRHVKEQRWDAELDIAVKDLLAENYFSLIDNKDGPYKVKLDIVDNRLVLNVKCGKEDNKVPIPASPFRRVIKDYFMVFDSYQDALAAGMHNKLEAIDMGRRGLHNEGAEILIDLLEGKINLDFDTARRLFTIITVLHKR